MSPTTAASRNNFPMDEAVVSEFPPGTIVLSAQEYGASAWTQTGRVLTQDSDGSEKEYFLKLAFGDHGRQLIRGEFTAISTIYAAIPDLVPKPLAWGKYQKSSNETYFFIEDFHDMDMKYRDVNQIVQRVVQLHNLTSPNGMFGFSVPTFDGIAPHITDWNANWTEFFVTLLRKSIEINQSTNHGWPELNTAAERILTIVVPRLLNPLREANGGPIVPRLIHGDLWGGNIGRDEETGQFIFFDAGSFYAHNELDIAMWRRHGDQNLGSRYIAEYTRLAPPAQPLAEFDDRGRLYSLKYDLNHSSGVPGDKARDNAFNNMVYLCRKYASADGLPEYDLRKDPLSNTEYISISSMPDTSN